MLTTKFPESTARAIRTSAPLALFALGGIGSFLAGCSGDASTGPDDEFVYWDLPECDFNLDYIADGGTGLDGIPAISDPIMVAPDVGFETDYLADDHRVIGFVVDGQPLAFPLSALWYHEVVNLTRGDGPFVVTHGTLSGTSRVFRRSVGGGSEFGVSGLLYQNNVLIYDRAEAPSLWSQLTGRARCGPLSGTTLAPYPFMEVTWSGWKTLFPNTLVLGNLSSGPSTWGTYPYGDYESVPWFFFDPAMPPIDERLPPKERVLGIPDGDSAGVAFPFGPFLEAAAAWAVAHGEKGGRPLVVFWSRDLSGAVAYWADPGGQPLTFTVQDDAIVDQETGTTWTVLGAGSDGGLAGTQLEPLPDAGVAYWGVWAAFYPETRIWDSG